MLFTIVALAACSSQSSGEFTQIDPPGFNAPIGDTDPPEPSCGPADLCARTIDECGVQIAQDECEAWYEVGECTDMDAYTACNCTCEAQDTCDGYFACGEICFDDHC